MPSFRVLTDGKAVRVVLRRRPAGKGKWYFAYWLHNKKVEHCADTYKERDARKAAKDSVLNASAGVGGSSPMGASDLKALVLDYLDTRWPQYKGQHEAGNRRQVPEGVKPKRQNRTYEDYCGRLLGFARWAQDAGEESRLVSMSALAVKQLVQRYADFRHRENLGGRSVRNDAKIIRRFFTGLMKRYTNWEYNPASFKRLELPEAAPVEVVPVTLDDLYRLVAITRGTPLWPLTLLTLGCGARSCGACDCERRHLQLDEWPKVKLTEKGESRLVTLTPGVVAEFKAWLPDGLPGTALLWPAGETSAHNMLDEYRKKANPPLAAHVTWQSLRRVHSTLCYRAGFQPSEESRRLGHSVVVADKSYVQWGDLEGRKMGLGNPLEELDRLLCKMFANPEQKPEQAEGGTSITSST